MKARSDDPAQQAFAEERQRLQAKVGQLSMENELLYERCHNLDAALPPAPNGCPVELRTAPAFLGNDREHEVKRCPVCLSVQPRAVRLRLE